MKRHKETYQVAVIGAGAIGELHAQGFQRHPAARVAAIVDTHVERAREVAERLGIPEVVADYRDVLKRRDIDAVSVGLPNHLHAKVGLDAIQAGKHVMMEKPMAVRARDAARMAAAAARKRVVLMVGQNQRFSERAQALKQVIARGDLGRIYHADAFWLRRAGIPRIGSWFTQRKFAGGGCNCDIGVHALDLALHLAGDFDAAAVSAKTFAEFGPRGHGGGTWGKGEVDARLPFDVEDFAVAFIRMRSGRTLLLQAAWACHQESKQSAGVRLYGTEGGASTETWRLFRHGDVTHTKEPVPNLPPLVAVERESHFIDCLLGKAKPFVKPAESVAVQRILDAIYESSKLKREVRIRK